ncbi:uncharacterized protein EI90DRAFT_817561 [Cantharellus anzutake]|uniref:uncharacterized protein n=1 Tax=Cantharellus anzutake TaxID=1750568 RepID=UPI0019058259|nr:uncharacterized protein EI90DRAFT_817561 [Cantharellus anzutake]KAF8342994.1 hypothetical protein EI90DRAFT_817561 [Cantharellus anzutake]
MASPAASELRRMASNPAITLSPAAATKSTGASHLSARKASPQPLAVSSSSSRLPGSRPSSIPSSPTSVHSSSSAIFERDIEPVSFHAPAPKHDPHLVSRAQLHESTEASVPAVLTSAMTALSMSPSPPPPVSLDTSQSSASKRHSSYEEEISVITPAVNGSPTGIMLSGIATPKSISRSPSPPSGAGHSPSQRPSMLEKISTNAPPPALSTPLIPTPISPTGSPDFVVSQSQKVGKEGNISPPGTAFLLAPSSVSAPTTAVPPVKGVELPASPRQETPNTPSTPIPRLRKSHASLSNVPLEDATLSPSSTSTNEKRLSFISYHVSLFLFQPIWMHFLYLGVSFALYQSG